MSAPPISSSKAITYQIRIKTTTPPPTQKVLKLSTDWSIEKLKKEIRNSLGKKGGKEENSKNNEMELLSGFPPKVIQFTQYEQDERTLKIESFKDEIRPNDTLLIRFQNENVKPLVPNKTKKKRGKPSAAPAALESKKPRRAAAELALSSFKDTIKAQDAVIAKEKKEAKNKKKASSSLSSKNKITQSGNIARLKTTSSGSNGIKSISDSKKRPTFSSKNTMKTQDDVALQLLSASSSASNGKKVNVIIKTAMKNAVLQAYETSRAYIRISAVQSYSYEFKPCPFNSSNNTRTLNSIAIFNIEYSKGSVDGGRGTLKDEDIEIISLDALKAVITTVYNDGESREMLRVENMAQLSPRVFWSIVYHSNQEKQQDDLIYTALQRFLPHLEFGFLNTRKKMLSEKARENLRQQEANEEENVQEALNIVQEVQKAMTDTLENEENKRKAVAQAAFERFGLPQIKKSKELDWHIETPSDCDYQELRNCINSSSSSFMRGQTQVEELIKILVKQCHIHNWRELANVNDAQFIFNSVKTSSLQTQSLLDEIKTWIMTAQVNSLEEIMIEICDNNVEHYITLRDQGSCSTPKDLALWVSIPKLLLNTCTELTNVNEACLKIWCQRAKIVLKQWDWIQEFVTPVP